MTNDSQQLRESMWDFVYGLLSAEETQTLIARIKSEPDIARLYAEVQLQAELVTLASRVEDSSIVLNASAATVTAAPKAAKHKAASGRPATRPMADFHRGGTWLAGIGVTALAALLAVGFFWPRPSQQQLAQHFVAADVSASQPIQAGLSNRFVVRTYSVSADRESDKETAASVELRLVDRTGQERFRKSVSTGENGQATVDIPGNALEPGVRLELAAAPATPGSPAANLSDDEAGAEATSLALGQTTVGLPVNPEPQMAYVLISEPNVDAKGAAQFSVWNFATFSVTPDSRDASLSVSGGLAVQANGATRLLADEVNKSAPTPDSSKKDKARLISAAGPVTVTIPPELAGKSLAFAATCRGVTVATATSPESVPASKNTTGQASSGDQLSLALPPEADGLIEIEFYDRSLGESAPVHREQVYREPARRLQIDLPNAVDRYAPGQEVELAVRVTDERGQPAANTRVGVRVWNERVVRQSNERPVLLADAVRSGASRPEIVGADRRQAKADSYSYGFARGREADADAAAVAVAKPATGEALQEESKYAEVLAIAAPIELASNREAVQAAFRDAVDRAGAQRQRTTEIIGGAAIFGAIALLVLMGVFAALRMSASMKAVVPALIAAAAGLLVGLVWVGWLPQSKLQQIAMARAPAATAAAPLHEAGDVPEAAGATQPSAIVLSEAVDPTNAPSEAAPAAGPALAATPAAPAAAAPAESSLGVLRPDLQRAGRAAALSEGVTPEPNALSRGGEALSALSRSNSEKKAEELAISPAGSAAGAAGAFGAGRLAAGGAEAAPGAQVRLRSAGEAGAKEARDDLADKKSDAAGAPPSLYFNPQLMTDANGLATIRFVMPPVDSEYRVLIDALGQGRIGSRQALIVGSNTPAAAK